MGELVLSDLFQVMTTVELPGKTVIVTALGDLGNRQRDTMSRLASQKYRKKLRDAESEEYSLLIEPLAELKTEELKNFLVMAYSQLEGQTEAREQAKPIFVAEPDNASHDEKLDAIEDQTTADEAANKRFEDTLKKVSDDYKASIESWDDAKLLAEAKLQAVSFYALSEYLRSYLLASVLISTTYQGKRLFPDLEAVDNAQRNIVNQLYSAFQEVNSKDSWELAKSTLRGETTG
jgi:hypothetical protein